MNRILSLVVGITLILGVVVAPRPSLAAMVFQEAGPGGARGGLDAVAIDPEDPRVAWVTDGGRVWVTDDGGDTWQPVMKALSLRSLGGSGEAVRERRSRVEQDDEASSFGVGLTDGDTGYRSRVVSDDDEEEPGPRARRRSRGGQGPGSASNAGLRLRVVGDSVYLAHPAGLWVADRAARNMGSDRRIRLGQPGAVHDLVASSDGGLWVGTSNGLVHLDPQERARGISGALADRPILALCQLGGRLIAATPMGLWEGSGERFQRLGVSIRSPRDLYALDDTHLLVPGGQEVARIRVDQDGAAAVLEAWPLADIHRAMADSRGNYWAAGSRGLWRRAPGGGWELTDEGISDRRIHGLAASSVAISDPMSTDAVSPPASMTLSSLWVVGRGGGWRRVGEVEALERPRGKSDSTDPVGLPTAWEVLESAHRARSAQHHHLGRLRGAIAVSWVLPEVQALFSNYHSRNETRVFVPELERLLLTDVDISVGRPEWRLVANWDLMPVALALLDLTTPYGGKAYQEEVRRVVSDREELRERVIPLYNQWVAAQERAATTEPRSVKDALRRRLELERLEADLHAVTAGEFVMGQRRSTESAPGPGSL